MLVLVLCSFGMAADKYFFKLNQHHSLPSPGEGRELGEHRELGKLGETTPWMNPGASNKDVLNRAAELMLDSIFSGSPRRWSGASDHMAGEALTLSPPASPASPASPALFGDECLALTQTQGMAVIPATGEVIVCL